MIKITHIRGTFPAYKPKSSGSSPAGGIFNERSPNALPECSARDLRALSDVQGPLSSAQISSRQRQDDVSRALGGSNLSEPGQQPLNLAEPV
jgi:hypothetical protein